MNTNAEFSGCRSWRRPVGTLHFAAPITLAMAILVPVSIASPQSPTDEIVEILRTAPPAEPTHGRLYPREVSETEPHTAGIGYSMDSDIERVLPAGPGPRKGIQRVPGSTGLLPADDDVLREGSSPDTGSASQLTPRIVPTLPLPVVATTTYPWRTVFKLLMRFPSGGTDYFYVCSAASTDAFHLLTAGHCIYNHDPNKDGSSADAGWATEVWAWAGQTDNVDPYGIPDWPYGEAKATYLRSYTGWTTFQNLEHDWALITLDRRIGDHVGWMGRESSVTGGLNYTGYPSESPYVPADNPFQYHGYDNGNVSSSTTTRIVMDAYTYGGHSGGPVWRFFDDQRWIEGVNSTSNRMGVAVATRLTSGKMTDINTWSSEDSIDRYPADYPDLIEHVFNTTFKDLLTNVAEAGSEIGLFYNMFNSGYAPAYSTELDFFLSTDMAISYGDIYLGTLNLGTVDAFTYFEGAAEFDIPANTPAGSYYVGWVAYTPSFEYVTSWCNGIPCNNIVVIADESLTVTGSSCGNGVVNAGEQCDDGNVVGGNCCSADCTKEPNGNACGSDGNACTSDVCSAGVCTHSANNAACNDGIYCNGTDTCQAGACSKHAGNPCDGDETCNESTDQCEAGDGDVVCGDFNGDGDVKAGDALAVLRVAVRALLCELWRCDFDGSGSITATDALAVLKKAVGVQLTPQCPAAIRRYQVTVRLIDAPSTVGSVQAEIDYSEAAGEFVGTGTNVECTTPLPGAIFSAADTDNARRLAFGVISLSGFSAPSAVLRCQFDADSGDSLTADNFALQVLDATNTQIEPIGVDLSLEVVLAP